MGEEGEVDFKEDAKFATHLKKGEAVSEFALSKTLAQQRQYLPIFSVRDELLQVCYLPFCKQLLVLLFFFFIGIFHTFLSVAICLLFCNLEPLDISHLSASCSHFPVNT